MALTTTLSGLTSDSYGTIVEADAYFDDHYDTTKSDTWGDLAEGQKEMLLRQATQILETISFWDTNTVVTVSDAVSLQNYAKSPAVLNQALSFPRNVDITSLGAQFIPTDVKYAQFEQAIYLKTSLNEAVINSRMLGLLSESVKAGSVSVSQTFADGAVGAQTSVMGMISPIAMSLLKKFITSRTRRHRM